MVKTLCNGRNTGGQQKLRPLRYTLNLSGQLDKAENNTKPVTLWSLIHIYLKVHIICMNMMIC